MSRCAVLCEKHAFLRSFALLCVHAGRNALRIVFCGLFCRFLFYRFADLCGFMLFLPQFLSLLQFLNLRRHCSILLFSESK